MNTFNKITIMKLTTNQHYELWLGSMQFKKHLAKTHRMALKRFNKLKKLKDGL